MREGSVDAPTRHPIEWKTEAFWDRDSLTDELARVYDVCHGCRRCVSLCDSFPTLFDLIDESETLEVDGVALDDYDKVVDQCYMCDLCYLTKCPYVPPHEFNVDFPHLMLRAKAQNFKTNGAKLRDKVLTSTDALMSGISMIPLAMSLLSSRLKSTIAISGLCLSEFKNEDDLENAVNLILGIAFFICCAIPLK